MTKYQQLKDKHRQAMSDFEGIFYAFSNQQLEDGLAKFGIPKEEAKAHIASIGSGGFILKSRSQAFKEMIEGFDRDLEELKADPKALEDAIAYELANHEYCYTYDPTDALACINLEVEDVDPELMQRAINRALKEDAA